MGTGAKKILSGALALALSAVLAPEAADAQERVPTGEEQECTATLTPESVQSGQPAVSVTARLSGSVGEVDGFDGGESGVELAEQDDIPMREMTREEGEDEPQPIQTTRGAQSEVSLWLNTEDAEGGSHQVKLEGDDGECTANLSVGQTQGEEQPDVPPGTKG